MLPGVQPHDVFSQAAGFLLTEGYHFAGAAEFFFQGVIREILNCYEKAL